MGEPSSPQGDGPAVAAVDTAHDDHQTTTKPSASADQSSSSRNSPDPHLPRSHSRTSLGKRLREDSEPSSSLNNNNKRRRSSSSDATAAAASSSKAAKTTTDQSDSPPTKPLDAASSQQPDGPGSSPYGTRSRNRGGASRPNYAEDDYDFEIPAPTSRKSIREAKAAAAAAAATDEDKSPASGGRRSVAGVASTRSTSSALGKDSLPNQLIPGPSSFSAVDEGGSEPQSLVQPRKRKPIAAQASSAATPTSTHPPVATSTRKQTGAGPQRDLSIVTFTACGGHLTKGVLVADDKTRYQANDSVYLVCEPPGEPYYLARIMEFLHKDNDPNAPVDALKVNSIYRPRDIGRKVTDPRLVFASMQSETCPITSLRGKCKVEHRSRIADLDSYRRQKDCFYFSQLYERFIQRFYDMVPREKITNISAPLKKIIDEQWEFIVAEPAKTKELTSASKTCKVCGEYCANNESVDCAVCKFTYHMDCVDPPLSRKPARGFAWSCGACSRKQERKLEARNTPMVGEDGEDEEMVDEDVSRQRATSDPVKSESPTAAAEGDTPHKHVATKEQMAEARTWPWRYLGVHSGNEDLLDFDNRIYPRASSRIGPRHQANVPIWHGRPIQYVEAGVKRKNAKASGNKRDSKPAKETSSQVDSKKLSREKTPWVLDKPPGYIERGLDLPNNDPKCTAKLLSRPAQFIDSARTSRDTSVDPSRNATRSSTRLPEIAESSVRGTDSNEESNNANATNGTAGASSGGQGIRSRAESESACEQRQAIMDQYMKDAKALAKKTFGVAPDNTEFLDRAVAVMNELNFDAAAALGRLTSTKLKLVKFEGNDLKKFEEGVTKYGSSLMEITRHVKTRHYGDVVRFYYVWKKSADGEKIWGNFRDRKAKKAVKREENLNQTDDIGDDADDSAFDGNKAAAKKRTFECKFCQVRESRVWRRAPQLLSAATGLENTVRPKNGAHTVALCSRCALLWRRYGIIYENLEEIAKKIAQTGGRAFKRKENEEMFVELLNANIEACSVVGPATVAAAQAIGITVPSSLMASPVDQEGPRKRQKIAGEREPPAPAPQTAEQPKKKAPEKPPEPALIPEQPKLRTLPCAVCKGPPSESEEVVSCRHCRLSVHRNCYGIPKNRTAAKWACDPCVNDTTSQYSTDYKCVLCPTFHPPVDLFEPLKHVPFKKKTEREKEKEKLEKEMLVDAKDEYAKKQSELGRPTTPREPLKPTSGNKWIHVTCANWIPQIKFPDPTSFDKAEGMLSISPTRHNQMCRICNTEGGVCAGCHKCQTPFHVSCAQHQEYQMGFDVTPVKSTRRDAVDSITLGTDKTAEKGVVEAVVYCPEHSPKAILHAINEPTYEEGVNALQLFARHFKQADTSLTGTVRKAALVNSKTITQAAGGSAHRPSHHASAVLCKSLPEPPQVVKVDEMDEEGDRVFHLDESPSSMSPTIKQCSSCNTTMSAKFYRQERYLPEYLRRPGAETEVQYVCHRCHKRTPDYEEKKRARAENPGLTAGQLYPKIKWPSKGATPAPYQQSPYGTPQPHPQQLPQHQPAPPPPPPPPPLPPQQQQQQQQQQHHQQQQRHPPPPPPPVLNGVAAAAPRPNMPPPSPTVVSPYGVPPSRQGAYYDEHLRHHPPPRAAPMSPQVHHPPPPPLPQTHQHHQPQHHPPQANGYHPGPPPRIPPPLPSLHRPPRITTPAYVPQPAPPSASPTGSYRSAGAPLRYGDDPFATIPTQSPRQSYVPAQTSPRLRAGTDPKPEHGPPPRQEPPIANGASASPSLRHLIH